MPPEAPAAFDAANFAAALGGGVAPAGTHDGAGRAADARFAVYRNAVIVSLRDALAETFPATRRLMGPDAFAAAAVAYACAAKPASPVLWRYGAGFPAYLATLPGLAAYPFVPEAATLEFQRLDAYHAADAAPLEPEAVADVAAADLPRLVFAAHPAARVVSLPAGGFGAYAQNALGLAPDSAAEAALVTRPHLEVRIAPLSAAEAALSAALLQRVPLGHAALDADLLMRTLGRLLSAGAFAGLALSPRAMR